MSRPGRRIDAHLHLWDLSTGEYGWNTSALGPAHATFTADDAAAALAPVGIDGAILVQAADTPGDTERLLTVGRAHPWVLGVVGWLPLVDPDRAGEQLDRWTTEPLICGVRQLLHDHPDPELLDHPDVRRTLARLAHRGLPLDVPDAWPRLWPALRRLVADLPELTVVVDHLGKPPLGLRPADRGPDFATWRADLTALAAAPSVVAKVSGLGSCLAPGAPLRAVAPMVDVALEAFGPERLMRGGDWPVSLDGGSYAAVHTAVDVALGALSSSERADIDGGSAKRVYRLASGS